MAGVVWTVDPERITERIFGGPHFRAFTRTPEGMLRCLETGKTFDPEDTDRAWMDGRNSKPIDPITSSSVDA